MADFLATLRDRVLVLDGGFGTWMQAHDLGPDDFGGPDLEGCNENLVATRPDLIAALHDAYLSTGCDAVETATFGAFGLVLNEYDIADRARGIAAGGIGAMLMLARRVGLVAGMTHERQPIVERAHAILDSRQAADKREDVRAIIRAKIREAADATTRGGQ